jgi:tyrosine-specific transport protein
MITGCCVGAGTLGLPVQSAISRYVPSVMVLVFAFLFTTRMGLLLLEATLWFDEKVNLFSMADFALGRIGK